MVFFKALQDIKNWTFGDPTSTTFETRKTFFEVIFAAIGFLVVRNVANSILPEDLQVWKESIFLLLQMKKWKKIF